MAKNRTQDVTLRLSTKGKEELILALKSIGEEGERAAKKLERATGPANKGLVVLDESVKGVRDGLEHMAQRSGPLGAGLAKLGTGGLVAAAGIGAVVAALGAAVAIGKSAVSEFDRIGKAADNLRLSTDAYQALNGAAMEQGVALGTVETATRALTERTSQLHMAQGELYTRLKDTHPELLRQLAVAKDNDERFRLLSDAIRGASSETERNTIAYAAFGEAGLDMARLLERQEDGFDGLIDRMREAGLVIDEEVIRGAEEMQGQFDLAARAIDLNLKAAFVDLAPVLLGTLELLRDLTSALRDFVEGFKSVDQLSEGGVRRRGEDLTQVLLSAGVPQKRLDEVRTGGAPLNPTEISRKSNLALDLPELLRTVDDFNALAPKLRDLDEKDRQSQLARDLREVGKKELDRQLTEARVALDELQADMAARIEKAALEKGDILALLAEAQIRDEFRNEEARLQSTLRVVEEEVARRAAADAFRFGTGQTRSARTSEPRDNRGAAAAELLKQNDLTLSIELATERINALKAEGLLTDEQAATALDLAKQALLEQTPAYRENMRLQKEWDAEAQKYAEAQAKATEELREQERLLSRALALEAERFNQRYASPEQQRDRALSDLRGLEGEAAANGTPLDPDAVKRAMREIEEGYQRAREEASQFLGTQYAVEDLLWAATEGAEAFENAVERAAVTFINEFIGMEESVKSLARQLRSLLDDWLSQGSGGGWGGILSAGLSFLTGGGGGGGGAAAHGGASAVPVMHSGGVVGQGAMEYRGLGQDFLRPDEQMTILQDGELVLTQGQQAAIRGAMGGMTYAPVIDARGADPAAIARLENLLALQAQQFQAFQRQLPRQVERMVPGHMHRAGRRP